MADLFSMNDILGLTGGFGGEPAGGPSDLGQPSPLDAYAQAPDQTLPAAAAPTSGTGLGGLFGLLGGGGAAPAPADTGGGLFGSGRQGMIGLGLGLLAGNPFNKWGPALQGYQRGAAADLAARTQAQNEAYRQQELALRKTALGQQYEIAMKPQISFHVDPNTDEIRAFAASPADGSVREISIGNADKLSAAGVPSQVFNPFTQQYEDCPPGVKCKDLRKRYSDMYADVKMGKETAPQALARDSYQVVKNANDELAKDDLDLQAFKPNTSIAEGVAGTGRLGKAIAAKTSDPATTRFIEQKNAFMSEYAKWKRLTPAQAQSMETYFFGEANGNKAEAPIYRQRRAAVAEALQQAQGPAGRAAQGVQGLRIGDRKQFKQGWGVWNGTTYVPE